MHHNDFRTEKGVLHKGTALSKKERGRKEEKFIQSAVRKRLEASSIKKRRFLINLKLRNLRAMGLKGRAVPKTAWATITLPLGRQGLV